MDRNIGRGERLVGWVLLVAAFAVHAAILLQRPVVGVAENGDFWRVMKPAGIVPLEAYATVDHKYVSEDYLEVAIPPCCAGFSSAAVVAAAARFLVPGPTLDIRQMGTAWLLLFAAAFGLALLVGLSPLLCALLAWAALDVSYALYFNSFFADPAALLGVLGITLALLAWERPWRPALHRIALLAAAAAAGLSKNLYMATPLLLAGVLIAWPRRPWRAHLRTEAPLLVALAALGAFAIWHFTAGRGYRFPEINNHHMVFRGLATVADDPAALLAELGVDYRHARFTGRTFFELDAEDRRVTTSALRDVSRLRVAAGYLRQPARLRRAIGPALEPLREVGTPDPNFYDRSRPPAFYRGWWQFARLRGELTPLATLLLVAGVVAVAAAAWRRAWRGVDAAFAFLLLNAAFIVAASILGDGFFGLRRHTIAARFSLDLALAIVLYAGVRQVTERLWPTRGDSPTPPLPDTDL